MGTGAGIYHGAARMVGRPEAGARFPWLDARLWDEIPFPVGIPRAWADRITGPADPLALQALPDGRERNADAGDLADPVGEVALQPVPWARPQHGSPSCSALRAWSAAPAALPR